MSALDLTDALEHLNIDDATYYDEVQATVDAAEAAVAVRIGPLSESEQVSRVPGGTYALTLPTAPVSELVSVADADGGAVVLDTLYLDTDTGLITDISRAWFGSLFYDVTYTAGYDELPADLMYAVKEMVRHLWRTQRGGATRPGQGSTLEQTTPGYLIPNAVAELLEPYRVFRVS